MSFLSEALILLTDLNENNFIVRQSFVILWHRVNSSHGFKIHWEILKEFQQDLPLHSPLFSVMKSTGSKVFRQSAFFDTEVGKREYSS